MATTAADPVFIDTNVLVFANTATAPLHAEAQAALQSYAASGAELWISRQILREYLATLSRPQSFSSPVPAVTKCSLS
jgi:predicted nucleic acid-binding protein